jgi:hypothetical protein
VLVAAGLALLWLAIAAAVSLVPRAMSARSGGAAGTAAAQQVQTQTLRMAESSHRYGDWSSAAAVIESIDPSVPMSASDKHTYFRIGAESLVNSGSPLAGARYYERFLGMGAQIRSAECQGCHGPPSTIPPRDLADMRNTPLGQKYAGAMNAAGKLRSRRDELKAQLKKKPDDIRLRLLLYHLEKKLGNNAAVAEHGERLLDFDATAG